MPFLVLGIIVFVIGIYFFIQTKRHHDHEGEEGAMTVMIAGIILIFFYGLFYQLLARLTL